MSDAALSPKSHQYIAIVVQKTSELFVEYRVGPCDNHKMPEWRRFDLGELNALELIKVYYLKLGYSEADWRLLQSRLRLSEQDASGVYVISPSSDVRLYFLGLGVGYDWLVRKVSSLEFRDEQIKDIIAGKWPFKLTRKPHELHLLVNVAADGNASPEIHFTTFFKYQGDEFTSTQLALFAYWGVTQHVPIMNITLYWNRSLLGEELPPEVIDQARHHVEQLIEHDPDVKAGINTLLLGLADGHTRDGAAWQFGYSP